MRLLEPDKVPEWLEDPDVLGRMVDHGELAHDPEKGPEWYAAVRVEDPVVVPEESEANAIHVPERHVEPAVTPIVLPENPEMH